MADTKELKPHGVVNPTGTPWLKEVKLDAARNAVEHLRRQQEKIEYEQAKARGVTVTELIEKGREDLGLEDFNAENKLPTLEEAAQSKTEAREDSEEVERLKAELKAERSKNTRLQNKLEGSKDPDESAKETK